METTNSGITPPTYNIRQRSYSRPRQPVCVHIFVVFHEFKPARLHQIETEILKVVGRGDDPNETISINCLLHIVIAYSRRSG